MIYVIYVQSGREHDVVATLRDKNINAYAPAHDLLERKGGVWRMVRRMIFPTYVLLHREKYCRRIEIFGQTAHSAADERGSQTSVDT